MKTRIVIALALAFAAVRSGYAGTDMVRDYSAQAPPPPTYSYAPPPPPPPVYYAPPPVRVVVYPAYAPVVRVFGFHRFVRPRVWVGPGWHR